MTIDVDFSTISLKNALDLAILVEDEAEERYTEFAAQMEAHHTSDSATFFRFMAKNEAKHGQELAARRKELFGDEPVEVDRSMLWDVEAPEYTETRAFMSLRQALDVALAAETKAFNYFDQAIPELKNAEVKALFEELRAEEVEHQDMVKAEMAKLPDAPDFDADDFVDAPTAQ
jgi:rubrerythrin